MDATSFLNSTTFPTRLNSLDWKTVFFISLYTLIGFTVIVCNITVIATYWRFSDAKKDVANTFIVNLSYSDLLVGIINTPIVAIVEFYQGQWVFGEISCKIVLAVIYLDTFIPIVIMLMFIAHRRISISRNAKTRNFLRRRHINITMTFIWAILLFFYLIISFGFPELSQPDYVDYELFCEMEMVYHKPFALALTIFEFILPLICFFTMTINLLFTVWKQSWVKVGVSNRPNTIACQPNAIEKPHSDAAFGESSGAQNSREAETSFQPRIIGSNHTKVRLESSAVQEGKGVTCCSRRLRGLHRSSRALSAILLCHLIFWSPHAVTSAMRALWPTSISVATFRYATISLGFNSMVNPFLYAFSSRHYRMGIIRLLQRFNSTR